MFKSKKESSPLRLDNEKFDSLIGCETQIKGDLSLRASIRIDGLVEGNIDAGSDKQGAVVIGPTGRVHGHVTAHRVLVAGHVVGNIRALDRLELRANCCVQGDLQYLTLAIEHGADVQGTLNKTPSTPAATSEPPALA